MITKCNNSNCGITLRIPQTGTEARIRCPQCGHLFTVLGGGSFVIFDLETTGLYPDGCEIILMQRLGLSASGYRRHDARGDIQVLADAIKIMWRRLELDGCCSGIPRRETALPAV